MKKHILYIAVLTSSFSSLNAVAQTSTQNPFGITPGIDQSGGFFGTGLKVETSKGSSDVSANIGFDLEDPKTLEKSIFSITAATSLNKKTDRTDFITDTGLPSDYSVGGEFSHIFSNFNDDINADAMLAEILKSARDKCKTQFPAEKVKCSGLTGMDLMKSGFASLTTNREKQILSGNPNLSNFMGANFYVITLSGKVGEETQKYRSSMTFEETKESKNPYSISASMGYAPSSKAIAYFAGVSHEVSYKPEDQRTLCNSSAPVECFTSSFEEPDKKKETTVFGQLRYQKGFSVGRQEFPLGIEAKIAYDFESKVLGAEVPIYFSLNKEGDLIGGVRLRWDDDDDSDLSVGVFVGKKFNLFN